MKLSARVALDCGQCIAFMHQLHQHSSVRHIMFCVDLIVVDDAAYACLLLSLCRERVSQL